jgi:hypothetical protein
MTNNGEKADDPRISFASDCEPLVPSGGAGPCAAVLMDAF